MSKEDCLDCIMYDVCPIVKINNGPYENCLGPVFADPENPEKIARDVKYKIDEYNYKEENKK